VLLIETCRSMDGRVRSLIIVPGYVIIGDEHEHLCREDFVSSQGICRYPG